MVHVIITDSYAKKNIHKAIKTNLQLYNLIKEIVQLMSSNLPDSENDFVQH